MRITRQKVHNASAPFPPLLSIMFRLAAAACMVAAVTAAAAAEDSTRHMPLKAWEAAPAAPAKAAPAPVTLPVSDSLPVEFAADKSPDKIVARKHHSGKHMTEQQLRSTAAKLPQAAGKLMAVSADKLMPTWSTTTPPKKPVLGVIGEGLKNLALQNKLAREESDDDKQLQADANAFFGKSLRRR